MENYLVANCTLGKLTHEILIAYLNVIGFDSFEELENSVEAYALVTTEIEQLKLDLNKLASRENISYSTRILEPKNWNEVWESNFDPVIVDEKLVIRAEFHQIMPAYPMEIIISPKMAFGTGHHETTYMMLKHMLQLNLQDKEVLDYGSGTGILSVGASILNAKHIVAVDIQLEAEENAYEHMALNGVENITVLTGDLHAVPQIKYDVILANINRNVILDTMDEMCELLQENGLLLISGIMKKDKNLVLIRAKDAGLILNDLDEKGEWCFFNYTYSKK